MFQEVITTIILAFIQGLTEFIPVSSSGHLVLLHNVLPPLSVNQFAFDVLMHFATVLAVIAIFYQDIIRLARAWVLHLRTPFANADSRLAWLIIIATIPAAVIGYFFETFIETYTRSNLVVAVMLASVAVLMIAAERCCPRTGELTSLNIKRAIMIGCAQAVALIPGTSRSGITIIAGMAAQLKLEAAVRFSFLMAVPIILGASVKKIPQLADASGNREEVMVLAVGFFVAFVSGYLAIRYLLRYVRNHTLDVFAYYRLALAAVVIMLYFL